MPGRTGPGASVERRERVEVKLKDGSNEMTISHVNHYMSRQHGELACYLTIPIYDAGYFNQEAGRGRRYRDT